jgi:hypothetical protein
MIELDEGMFAPVQPGESESRTLGCRHRNACHCKDNRAPKVCALVRSDHVCLAPPATWRIHYRRLRVLQEVEDAAK